MLQKCLDFATYTKFHHSRHLKFTINRFLIYMFLSNLKTANEWNIIFGNDLSSGTQPGPLPYCYFLNFL